MRLNLKTIAIASSVMIAIGLVGVTMGPSNTKPEVESHDQRLSQTQGLAFIQHHTIERIEAIYGLPNAPTLYIIHPYKNSNAMYSFFSTDNTVVSQTIATAHNAAGDATDYEITPYTAYFSHNKHDFIGGYLNLNQLTQLSTIAIAAFMIIAGLGFILRIFGINIAGGKKENYYTITYPKNIKQSFESIFGLEKEKQILLEMIDYDPNNDLVKKLNIAPKTTIMLTGSPGNGKTSLAQALAKESNRPLIYTTGSSFDDKYVGVGANRLRAIHDLANKKKAILFIDEVENLVRARSTSSADTKNEEREATLTQFLALTDGSHERKYLLITATNRPEIIDEAFSEKRRNDRVLSIPSPTVAQREKFFQTQFAKIQTTNDIDFHRLACLCPHASYDFMKKIINEAKTNSYRRKSAIVSMEDITNARMNITLGEPSSLTLAPKDEEQIAWHEAGHLVMILASDDADPVDSATIVPRQKQLGCVIQLISEDQRSLSRKQIMTKIRILMSGRAAELIFQNKDINAVTTGATHDIRTATDLATQMVGTFGMGESDETRSSAWNSPSTIISSTTKNKIEKEVETIIKEEHKNAIDILEKNKKALTFFAELLIKEKTIHSDKIYTEYKRLSEGS